MADKDFGVKRINLVGAAGTPTITSPTDLIINANNVAISTNTTVGGSIGIGTTTPNQKLWVDGNGYFTGIVTATKFVGALDATYAQAQSVGFATTATNLAGGAQGSLPYQNSPGITSFLSGGGNNQVLLYSTGTNAPYWGSVDSATGAFPGIDVRDEDNASISDIKTLNFRGDNITAVSDSISGISTITVSSNIVGTSLSISGISTFNSIKISSGIVTAASGIATFYGDFVGTASSAGYANTALNLNGVASGDLNVAFATTATNVIGGIASVTSLFVNQTGISTLGTVKISSGIVTATTGIATFYGDFVGTASSAGYANTALNLNGVASGDLNVAYASTAGIASAVKPNSVALGSDTTGDYVQSISGTSNQITVTGGTGEGSTPILSIPNLFTVPQDLKVLRDVQIDRNLNVNGNITIGGTSAYVLVDTFRVSDPDIILGFRTDGSGNDVSNDTTANHGGIAVASTEGSPLVNLNIAGIETLPATYKKIMWFEAGSFSGLNTDAWLFNYAVGIGSTQFPSGTRLAAGNVQFTQNDLAAVRDINSTGVITATKFVGSVGFATTATNLAGGAQGSLPYQNSPGITSFLSGGGNNQVLLYSTGTNAPYWGNVSSGEGSFSGITVRDEGTNSLNNIVTVDIFGSNIIATGGGTGIASIRVSDTLVGTSLSISGITTLGTVSISSGIVSSTTGTAVTFIGNLTGTASYATTAGIATHLKGGSAGNLVYQISTDSTKFVTNGTAGQVLISNGSGTPYWSNVSAASGSFGGITVRDESDLVGTSGSITTLNFVGSNIRATATAGASGIATITISDNLVGTALSISGISTFNSVKIESGIITASSGIVTYYGDGSKLSNIISGLSITSSNASTPQFIGFLTTNTGTTTSILASSNLVYIPSSGNLGIGSTNPKSKLDVLGDVSVSGFATFSSGLEVTDLLVLKPGQQSSNLFEILNDAQDVVVAVTTSGNLGIGTTNPTEKLWVNGNGYFTGVVTATKFYGTIDATYASSQSVGFATTSINVIGGIASVTSLNVSGNSTVSGFATFSSGLEVTDLLVLKPGEQGSNLFEILNDAQDVVVAVTTTGNLGIGTTTPNQKLWVNGNGYFTGVVTATKFYGDGSTLTGLTAGVSISTNTTNQSQYLTYVTGTGSTSGFGVTTTGLVFNPSSGNLGIGSAVPTSKLTVQGDVLISGVTTSGITRISSSTASPNDTTPVATLEAVGASSNCDIAIVPKGTGAIVASIPDGTTATGGNKRGTYAVDLQLSRDSNTKVASGNYSFIGAGANNTASGAYSAILSGTSNIASGGSSFIGGGGSNTSGSTRTFIGAGELNSISAAFGAIVGGQSNTITISGSYSFIGGGESHTASSDYATIVGGSTNAASGQYSSVLGGRFSIANKNYSSVIGGYGANTRNTNGAVAFAGANTTFGTGSGVALQQARFAILSKETTDATLSVLTADGSASYTNNVLQVVTKSAYLVKGSVIAYSNASDISRAWEFTAVIKNTSGTVLVGTPIINDIAYDPGASGWNLSITADSGTSSLKVEVTGQASTTIRWVTKMDSTEVAFQ